MDNKVFGKSLLIITSSALLVFGVANAGSLAADKWLFPVQEFGSNTYIGTTDVSNMELTDARVLFAGKVESWRSTAELKVTYQDVTASYPLVNAEILLDATIENAQTGAQNNFIFQLAEDTTKSFLENQFPVASFTAEDITAITDKLELALQSGQALTSVTISDDTLGVGYETVSETSWDHSFTSAGAQDVVDALSNYKLEAGSQFSFLDFISQLQPVDVTDEDLTEIASALYASVLKTNFLIDERSVGAAVPTSIPLGFEAAINRSLGIDLVFTNVNASAFNLQLSADTLSITSKIAGMPFVHTYDIITGSEQKLEPRLIRQFSAFVTSGKVVEAEGSDGVIVEVTRTVNAEGRELEVQAISTDYYPPVHRIEIYPLSTPEAAVGEGTVNPDGTVTNPDGSITNPDGTVTMPDGTIITDPALPADTDPTLVPADPATEEPVIDSDLDGIPDNEEQQQEPAYDKGGNPIVK